MRASWQRSGQAVGRLAVGRLAEALTSWRRSGLAVDGLAIGGLQTSWGRSGVAVGGLVPELQTARL